MTPSDVRLHHVKANPGPLKWCGKCGRSVPLHHAHYGRDDTQPFDRDDTQPFDREKYNRQHGLVRAKGGGWVHPDYHPDEVA